MIPGNYVAKWHKYMWHNHRHDAWYRRQIRRAKRRWHDRVREDGRREIEEVTRGL